MLATFVLQLISGISLMWVVMPRRQVTSGFFRIQMLLVLALNVVVALSAGKLGGPLYFDKNLGLRWLAVVMGGMAFLGSILWTLERRKSGAICAFLIAGLSQIAIAVSCTDGPTVLDMLSRGSSGAVLGGTVTAMLLGHWYLTAPTMSITPLTILTRALLVSLVVRLALSLVCWWIGGHAIHGSLLWSWFALRWLAGIIAPLVLCGMTLRILRYRNTQAATGVLFAAVILSFIGEMSAMLLTMELRRPY
jgi:hypothetical protein